AGLFIGTGIGVAFMSKGLLEPALIIVLAALMPVFKPWRTWNYGLCLLLAAVVATPWLGIWPYALHLRAPELFTLWLSQQSFFGNDELTYFVEILPWFAWPALPLALWALWFHARRSKLSDPAIQLGLAAFSVFIIGLSLGSESRDVDALPLLLPLTLLATAAVDTLQRGAASALDWFGKMTFGLIAVLLWAVWLVMAVRGAPVSIVAEYTSLSHDFVYRFQPLAFFAALILSLAWILCITRARRSNLRAVTDWALGLTLCWGLLTTLWLPWLDHGKSYRPVFQALRDALPNRGQCVSSKGLGKAQRALVEYYAELVTQRVETVGDIACGLLLVQSNTRNAETSPGPGWRKIWEGKRPGDTVERYMLFQKTA
ncbi:MAG: hypothetical protein ACREUA_11170, partial [Burkholderiales bacterium]